MSKKLTARKVIIDLNELKYQDGAGWERIALLELPPVPETLEDAEREVRSLNIQGRVFCG